MSKKSNTSHKAELYSLNLQDLMASIPESTVAKQIDDFIDEEDGKILDHQIRWVVGDHIVYSGIRDVYSIDCGDTEKFKFILKRADYKKFVEACEKRRAEIFEQMKSRKK